MPFFSRPFGPATFARKLQSRRHLARGAMKNFLNLGASRFSCGVTPRAALFWIGRRAENPSIMRPSFFARQALLLPLPPMPCHTELQRAIVSFACATYSCALFIFTADAYTRIFGENQPIRLRVLCNCNNIAFRTHYLYTPLLILKQHSMLLPN